MDRAQPAARRCAIDQVVVDQGGIVDELDRHGGPVDVVHPTGAAQPGGQKNKRRPQSFSAGLQDLLHGLRHRPEIGADGLVQALFEILQLGFDGRDEIRPGHGGRHAAPSRPLIASTSSRRTVVMGGSSWPKRIRATSVKRSGEPVT